MVTPRLMAAALFFALSVLLGGASVGVAMYMKYRALWGAVSPTVAMNRKLASENDRLKREVSRRDERIAFLSFKLQKERDDYTLRLEQLDLTIKKLERFYTDLRIIAGFKLEARDAKKLGSGGPGVDDGATSGLLFMDGDAFASEGRRRERALLAAAAATEKEFVVLRRLLERRRSLLADVPDMAPVRGIITSYFGARRGRGTHGGLDIAAAPGTAVRAPAEGVVLVAGPYPYYGNVVILSHGGGFTSRYGHLSSVAVKAGDRVVKGDIIGRVGATGWATGSHLHYEVRINNIPVDPINYIPEKLPVHIVDGSKAMVVAVPAGEDLLIPDEVFEFYEKKAAASTNGTAP